MLNLASKRKILHLKEKEYENQKKSERHDFFFVCDHILHFYDSQMEIGKMFMPGTTLESRVRKSALICLLTVFRDDECFTEGKYEEALGWAIERVERSVANDFRFKRLETKKKIKVIHTQLIQLILEQIFGDVKVLKEFYGFVEDVLLICDVLRTTKSEISFKLPVVERLNEILQTIPEVLT